MIDKKLIKYLLVGVLNTIIGFGIIFGLMFTGISPEISNLSGYSIGIVISYILNKIFTFQSKTKSKIEFIKFILAMLMAYILNFITLKICLSLSINPYISQIFAGGIYTISGFLLSKFWVFK
ncbi:polysaccharide biosynthesis protein, GtrA family [Campylobacter ureolyticus RIGS 9880]|jgi:gtrA family protein|uniref:Polysaccharide biosynthesis protein, GtrA family n=1 Tax=Campylobacter ureolyticus RIGS 9880 TaxID=1032069 RepID=A0AAU8TYN9_9BACT|nr:GtrA family protein [Campylobacter ureolyticus]AKT90577.1 polysaccharide biosynthesis protein, GtrA family [Campylobacter ureolyticus RIGS 9880]MCZ6116343.1 GtrA family protein [Campylobacter ureolyticus]QIX85880.1 GtrA family protein [Campylobacter ureolyticus]STA70353.1 GtrA family protein [Campylobacter ureolyticus]